MNFKMIVNIMLRLVRFCYLIPLGALLSIFSSQVLADKSTVKTPQPLPSDITPRVIEQQCGGYVGFFGPFDYRHAHPDDIRVVEKYHFDIEYAGFLRGTKKVNAIGSTADVGEGFNYTLKALPNHRTALYAMDQLALREKTEKPSGSAFPVECWYVRAFKITPDDPAVRAMYGIYLANRGRNQEALHNLDMAERELPDDANLQYNIGLMYFKLGQYEKAQLCAIRAKKLRFGLNGLEGMLRRANKWNSQLQLPPEEESNSPEKTSDAIQDQVNDR